MIENVHSACSWIASWPWTAVGEIVKTYALPLAAPLAAIYVTNKFGHIQAAIGRRQAETAALAVKTARHKLRLDLFDKRVAIYEAAMKALTTAQIRGGPLTDEEYVEYRSEVQAARWLFGKDISHLLIDTMSNQLLKLHSATYHIPEDGGLAGGALDKLVLLTWLDEQKSVLGEMMAPYLLFAESDSQS